MKVRFKDISEKLRISSHGLLWVVFSLLVLCPSTLLAHAVPTEKIIDNLMDKGEQASGQGRYLDAIKHFLKVRQLADENNIVNYQCLSRYDIGVCYFLMSAHGEALHNYYEAYKLCKKNHFGWKRESKIVNGIAGVYFEQEDYHRAYDFIQPVYREALRQRDTLSIQTFATDLALICNKLGRFGASGKYIDEAMKLSDYDAPEYAHGLTIKAEAQFLQKRYPQAEETSLRVLSMKTADRSDRDISLIYLIKICTMRNDFQRALDYVDEARPAVTLRNKPYFFEAVSELYRKTDRLREALDSKDSVIVYTDSLAKLANRQLLENSRMKLEVLHYTSDMDQTMAKMRQRHYVMLMLLCVSVFLVIIAFIVVRNQKAKSRHQSQLLAMQVEQQQREKEMAEERMKAVEMEAHYRQEMMKQSLEQKQRELSATTMFISSRNELIEDLLNYLNTEAGMNTVPAVKTLIQHLGHLLKESSEHDNFLVNFEAANPGFMQKLQSLHPDLLPSDLRFLAYVRMNMQTKEIASLLNINPESCRRRKIRLSKKLGLESSSDLYQYIIGMQ